MERRVEREGERDYYYNNYKLPTLTSSTSSSG